MDETVTSDVKIHFHFPTHTFEDSMSFTFSDYQRIIPCGLRWYFQNKKGSSYCTDKDVKFFRDFVRTPLVKKTDRLDFGSTCQVISVTVRLVWGTTEVGPVNFPVVTTFYFRDNGRRVHKHVSNKKVSSRKSVSLKGTEGRRSEYGTTSGVNLLLEVDFTRRTL